MLRFFLIGLLAFIGLRSLAPAAPSNPAVGADAAPRAFSRLPDGVTEFLGQLDGSAVCASAGEVYLSLDDARRWSEVEFRGEGPIAIAGLSPVGGDRKRLFCVAQIDGDWRLVSVSVGGRAALMRKLPSHVAAFASGDIGAVAVQSSIVTTNDGGATWKHGARLPDEEQVSALKWLSDSRLLVGGRNGRMQLLERQGDKTLRAVWSVSLAREHVMSFCRDGDFVWVRGRSFHRMALADGHEDGIVKPRMHVEGFAACHGSLMAWDSPSESLYVWRRDADGRYQPVASIDVPEVNGNACSIAAVFPEKAPACLAIAEEGQAFSLDLEKKSLRPVELHVTRLPESSPVAAQDVAAPEQIRTMVGLARQVPPAERDAIFGEANKKTDLTPRQRAEWAIQELQRIIDAKKSKKPKE